MTVGPSTTENVIIYQNSAANLNENAHVRFTCHVREDYNTHCIQDTLSHLPQDYDFHFLRWEARKLGWQAACG